MEFSLEGQRQLIPDTLDWNLSIDDMVGASEASSADRRRTKDEERTDDFLDGVFSEASSADRWSEAVLAGFPMVWSSAEKQKRSELGSSMTIG